MKKNIFTLVFLFNFISCGKKNIFAPIGSHSKKTNEDIAQTLKAKKYDSAIEKIEKAQKKDPNNHKLKEMLIEAYLKKNNLALKENLLKNWSQDQKLDIKKFVTSFATKDLSESTEAIKKTRDIIDSIPGDYKSKNLTKVRTEVKLASAAVDLKKHTFSDNKFDKQKAQRELTPEKAQKIYDNLEKSAANYEQIGMSDKADGVRKLIDSINLSSGDQLNEKLITLFSSNF